MTKRNKDLPEKLAHESNKVYRLRVIPEIFRQYGPMSYHGLMLHLDKIGVTATQRTLVRDLQVLVEREEVNATADENDGRRTLWEAVY